MLALVSFSLQFFFLLYFSLPFYHVVFLVLHVVTKSPLLSSYHHLVWLALIGNSSELTFLYTPSKLIMSSKCTAGIKTPANTKHLQSFFEQPGQQVPRDDSSMDWSEDIHEVQASPTPRVPPVRENMSSPRAPLHNRDVKGKERTDSNDFSPSLLNYGGIQPAILSS